MKKIISKIKRILNKNLTMKKLCLVTFIFSSIIISIIYVLNKVSPFGDKSLLQVDFFHQYGPMLGELYDRIHNFSSIIYSFNMGLGLPIFRNFLNYMSSPFNIIMLFFKRCDIVTSYSVIIGLKAVVSSVTMVYYLGKKYKTTELYLIPFGLIYAFSAYFSAYYWNLMWLDGMVFLPLITLGIENIINDGKWKFYSIWLAVMLLANYYVGYMICIFACLYFFVYSFNKFVFEKEKIISSLKIFLKDALKFGIGSLIAGGIVAVFLIPLYFSISSISATGGVVPNSQYYLFTFSDFLKYHFSGVMPTVFASDEITAPNISCGILAISLALVFIINVWIPIKEKIGYMILLGFFVVAFFYAPLDYILQGFHVPNDLPYRYSFIYSFVLVLISVYSFRNIKKMNYRLVMLVYIFLSLSLFMIASSDWIRISENMVYINMLILAIYFIFYSLVYTKRINLKIVYLVMILFSGVDVIWSINENFEVTQFVDNFYSDYDNIHDTLDYINANDDDLFYRIERENTMTLNDTSWYNYYGMTSFSSMNYENMALFQYDLGMAGNSINSYIYKQNTPIYDMMFDIKYLFGDISDTKRYNQLSYLDNTLNVFNYNISLGYGISKNIDKWYKSYTNPFIMQEEYIKFATGISDTLVSLKSVSTKEFYKSRDETIVSYTFDNPGDNMYFYTNNYSVDFIIINNCLYYRNNSYLNYSDIINDLYYQLDDYEEEHMVNFISDYDEVTIYVGYNYYDTDSFNLYTINHENFDKAMSKLQNNRLNITSFKETRIEGNIVMDNDMIMYTSIPYDDGWHVLVDGKEVKTNALGRALLTFDVPVGEHDIVIYYRIKGFLLGFIVSILSILLLFTGESYYKKIFNGCYKNRKISIKK